MLCCCTKLLKFCDVSKLHIVLANYLLALFYMNISYLDCPCIINMHIIFISLRRTWAKKQTHKHTATQTQTISWKNLRPLTQNQTYTVSGTHTHNKKMFHPASQSA